MLSSFRMGLTSNILIRIKWGPCQVALQARTTLWTEKVLHVYQEPIISDHPHFPNFTSSELFCGPKESIHAKAIEVVHRPGEVVFM